MKNKISFFDVFFAMFIDFLICFTIFYLGCLAASHFEETNLLLKKIIIAATVIISLTFLALSNVFFRSAGFVIFSLVYKSEKYKRIKIFVGNVIDYAIVALYFNSVIENQSIWIKAIFAIIVGIEFFPIFIPAVNNRLLLYILKTKILKYEKVHTDKIVV